MPGTRPGFKGVQGLETHFYSRWRPTLWCCEYLSQHKGGNNFTHPARATGLEYLSPRGRILQRNQGGSEWVRS